MSAYSHVKRGIRGDSGKSKSELYEISNCDSSLLSSSRSSMCTRICRNLVRCTGPSLLYPRCMEYFRVNRNHQHNSTQRRWYLWVFIMTCVILMASSRSFKDLKVTLHMQPFSHHLRSPTLSFRGGGTLIFSSVEEILVAVLLFPKWNQIFFWISLIL